MNDLSIAVILPAFNEESAIRQTIVDFAHILPDAFFCIVDNNSTDNTKQIATETLQKQKLRGLVISESRRGKAIAVRSAFLGTHADLFILVDADYTYPAEHVHSMINAALSESAEMVVGDRHNADVYKKVNTRRFHQFGNTIIRRAVNWLFKSQLNDILSGYRVFTNRFISTFPILTNGFQLELELTLHALDKRMKIVEVPVAYRSRPADSFSKLNTLVDGIAVALALLKIFSQYRALRFYGTIASTFSISGLLLGIPAVTDYITYGRVDHLPSAVLATALQTLASLALCLGLILENAAESSRHQFEISLLNQKSKIVENE
jgi:glycosyltransferase involved in cell wall biosynthesis